MTNKVRGRTWLVDNSWAQLVVLANIGLLYDYIIASRLICNSGVYVGNVTARRLLPTHVRKVIDGIYYKGPKEAHSCWMKDVIKAYPSEEYTQQFFLSRVWNQLRPRIHKIQ